MIGIIIISLFHHLSPYPLPPPGPEFSPSLIRLVVSVDVKHHVYLITTRIIPCIKMGSDESHFSLLFIERQVTTDSVPTNHNFWWERKDSRSGRPNPCGVSRPLTSLPPWPLGQVGSLQGSRKLDKHRCQAPARLWFVDTVL